MNRTFAAGAAALGGLVLALAPAHAVEVPPAPVPPPTLPVQPPPLPVPVPVPPAPPAPPAPAPPSVPRPALPPVTPPAPPVPAPRPPQPVAPARPPASAPAPAPAPSPSPSAPPARTASYAPPASGGATASARPEPARRATRSEPQIRRERVARRVVVRLDFTLPRAQRLFLVVRGPLPSCGTLGAVSVRGRRGENTVRFAGRLGTRRLDPGVYLLTLWPARALPADTESEAVRVVSPTRTVPVDRDDRPCAGETAPGVDRLAELASPASPSGTALPASRSLPPRPAAPLRPPVGVPPVAVAPRGLPPVLESDGATTPLELAFTVVVFALVGGVLVLLFALLSRALDRVRKA